MIINNLVEKEIKISRFATKNIFLIFNICILYICMYVCVYIRVGSKNIYARAHTSKYLKKLQERICYVV